MARILFVGQVLEAVGISNSVLLSGLDAEPINASIALAVEAAAEAAARQLAAG